MSPEMRDDLLKANELQAQIGVLLSAQDALLEPIYYKLMNNGSLDEIREGIDAMPNGFWRSELETFLNRL